MGLGLIVLTNVIALAGVGYNRSGEPNSVVALTQRELNLPYGYWNGNKRDNTGLYLKVNWRVYDPSIARVGNWGFPDWLNKVKLSELGFDVERFSEDDDVRAYRSTLPRTVVLVLELDGDTYKKVVESRRTEFKKAERELKAHGENETHRKQFETAQNALQDELNLHSRLFVIDAGLDANLLRKKYSDKKQYILAKGQVRLRYFPAKDEPHNVGGQITKLIVDQIHVPLKFRSVFLNNTRIRAKRNINDYGPKFTATVVYGQRLEPWLLDAKLSQAN
jgi:hypothetical protein